MNKKIIHFTKMHGAGNDYIYVNTLLHHISNPSAVAIEWSRPHFGIGSDGLILIGKASTPDADFSMRIFNNDGSEAMMCGNGTRCVAKFLHDKGVTHKNPIRLETLSGIKVLQLHLDAEDKVESVTVDMGAPILQDPQQFAANGGGASDYSITVDDRTFQGTFVSMGNPHFVIFLDEDVEQFDLSHYASVGTWFRHHPCMWHRSLCHSSRSSPHRPGKSPEQYQDGWWHPPNRMERHRQPHPHDRPRSHLFRGTT